MITRGLALKGRWLDHTCCVHASNGFAAMRPCSAAKKSVNPPSVKLIASGAVLSASMSVYAP